MVLLLEREVEVSSVYPHQEILDWINRWGIGATKLECGILKDPEWCALSKTFKYNGMDAKFAGNFAVINSILHPLPDEVKSFIIEFDAGKYPDLILSR